jgi:hypothetical protein
MFAFTLPFNGRMTMGDQANPATPSPAPAAAAVPSHPAAEPPTPFSIERSWKVAGVAALIMVLLALVGIALTTSTDYTVASLYWVCLVPFYGLLCVATAWRRHGKHFDRQEVIRQGLHWLAIGAALALDFLARHSGVETGEAAGLNAMLLLALGCFLAGVHLEWFFAVVGLLLAAALIFVVKAEQYLGLVLIVGGLAAAAMVAYIWLLGPKHRSAVALSGPHTPAGS